MQFVVATQFGLLMAIETVFFDAAGTLIKPARRVGESYAATAGRYGMNVAAADLAARFRTCFAAAPRLAFPNASSGELPALERAWWKRLVAQVFEPWGRFERFDDYFNELFGYFAAPDAWALYPEVVETLGALKARGMKLDVISNFDSRLVQILEGLGVASWFGEIFVSSRAGYAKPDARIFHAALTHRGIRAEQALHVGDSEINDLQGANNAGLKGVLVDRSAATSAGVRIADLQGILSLIEE